jgi:hypothetical protein
MEIGEWGIKKKKKKKKKGRTQVDGQGIHEKPENETN